VQRAPSFEAQGTVPAPARPAPPVRHGRTVPAPERAQAARRARLIAEADALTIPWEKILAGEIAAERTLRVYCGSATAEPLLWQILAILPNTLLESWRVRERIQALAWQASSSRAPQAIREIRKLARHLCGARRDEDLAGARASHLAFAHARILELERIAHAAQRATGSFLERVTALASASGCSRSDAEWAVRRSEASSRTHALDDAVERAREEGFDIPPAATPLASFRLLRRFVRKNPLFGRRARRPATGR
jgi:hypothetical protein